MLKKKNFPFITELIKKKIDNKKTKYELKNEICFTPLDPIKELKKKIIKKEKNWIKINNIIMSLK